MLPPIARRRAGEVAGLASSWPREQTVVIGDTPRDIACAHADDLRCVAVTTGTYSAPELSVADHVVGDAQALAATLDSLASASGA
jgi:phosphoglycolate phosphatase-like HAD superfamily hydrolase